MIEIVPMDSEHLDEVYRIETEVFTMPWSRRDLEKELKNHMAIYKTALMDGKICGYCGMWHIVTEGHITNLAVDPFFRRQGVGAALLTAMLDAAREKEMLGVTLEVRISNTAAQKLYSGFGFRPEGFRKNYYEDTKEDAIIMWKYFDLALMRESEWNHNGMR